MEHVLNCTGYEMLIENVVKAEGYYLYDSNGRKYLDFESGVWSISLGHCNSEFNSGIKKQLDKVMHLGFRYTSQLVEDAAKAVIDTLQPFKGKCVFLSSGSEAVELAVKAAKHMIKEKKLLAFDLSYLSAYGHSGMKDNRTWHLLDLMKCISCNGKEECGQCSVVNDISFDEIGAFVFEPGNSSGLVLLPPKALIQEIQRRIKGVNGLVVVDEVTTGIGRTGKWYGYQNYGLKPDIVAIGKGLGNGYPISAAVIADNISEVLIKEGFKHSQSHQNDALGCAVVKEVIRIIKDKDLIHKADIKGQYMMQGLHKLQSKMKSIKDVRGLGLMIGVEFTQEQAGTAKQVFNNLFAKGFIVGCNPKSNLIRFYPTLTASKEDIDLLMHSLEEVLCSNNKA